MCRSVVYLAAACFSLTMSAFAQDSTDASYSGTWLLQNNSTTKWVFEQHGDRIRIQKIAGSETVADYTCNTSGKECDIKIDGHKATVSLWFNGNDLVELETRGHVVVKRRFEFLKDGKQMDVETIPISPPGKTEKLTFSPATPGGVFVPSD